MHAATEELAILGRLAAPRHVGQGRNSTHDRSYRRRQSAASIVPVVVIITVIIAVVIIPIIVMDIVELHSRQALHAERITGECQLDSIPAR